MRRTYLGEFEEVVLQKLEQQTGREVTFGTVHNTLIHLEEKGFVNSQLGGATSERGGRRKRLFTLTPAGRRALKDIGEHGNQLWQPLSPHILKPFGL